MDKLNQLGETIVVSSDNVKLDDTIKRMLAEKPVISWILSYAVEEFRGMKPNDVVPYLGDISVSHVPIMPGSTNSVEVIDKLPEESKALREGLATYDVRFFATSPHGGETPAEYRLIINVEGQKIQKPGYDITTRGIVYCARQISEQLGRNIMHGQYQNVEKVYSIWIVMDCSQESANTISQARWVYEDLVGHYDYQPRIDIERVVIIRLPKDKEWDKAKNKPERIHEMLSTLLSNEIQPIDKLKTLDRDFDIPVTDTLQEEVENMCNYSSVIRKEGYDEGRNEGLNEGFNKGRNKGRNEERENIAREMIKAERFSEEDIARFSHLPIKRIKELKEEALVNS